MERFGWLTGTRVLRLAALALFVVAVPHAAIVQTAPAAVQAPDPLKFETSTPLILGWQVRPDKTKEFEDFWAGIRALLAKSENAELKAFGETLTKVSRVDQPPYDAPVSATETTKVVLYLFHIETPSTTYSYNPVPILYTYLGAGVEGSKVTRAEGDALYEKFKASFVNISPLWKLIKVN